MRLAGPGGLVEAGWDDNGTRDITAPLVGLALGSAGRSGRGIRGTGNLVGTRGEIGGRIRGFGHGEATTNHAGPTEDTGPGTLSSERKVGPGR